MAIKKVSESTKKAIRENSVLALPDKPSEKGYSAQQLKEYFTNLVLGDVSSITELDRVVEEINGYIEGIEDTTIKNFIVDTVVSKFTQQAPFISLKFEDNKLKYTRFGNPSISGELDIIPENSVFFDNEQLKSKTNENIYPKTTLENIIGGIGGQSFKEYLLGIKTKIDEIESNHEIDIKSIEDSLSQIIGGDAPEALDSIKELAEALKNNPSSLDDILLQISNLRTGKVDVVAGKQLSTNDFDNSSKAFLDELKNKDVALKTDIKTNLSELKEDSQHRLVTDDEKASWDSKATGVHKHEISDVNLLQQKLDEKSDVEHTHTLDFLGAEQKGTAEQLIGNHNQNEEAHQDIRKAISDVSDKVDGINNALSFENFNQLTDWFNGAYNRPDGKTPSDLYVGQYLYLKNEDEEDYWVSEIPATISNLSVLQTDKIDLSEYPEKSELKRVAFTGSYTDLTDKPTIPTNLSELKSDESHNTITNEKLQQIDTNKSNIDAKLDKNLGSSEANKMLITDSSGNISTAQAGSMSILVDNLESDSTTMAPTANQARILNNIKLDKQQGTENAGKHLVVNDSGLVDLVEQEAYLPLSGGTLTTSSGSVALTVKSANNNSFVKFAGTNGTLGHLGVNYNKKPIFYDTEQRELALKSDIPDISNLATKEEIPDTSGLLPLTAGSSKKISGVLYCQNMVALDNNKALSAKNASGTTKHLISINTSDNILINNDQLSTVNIGGTSIVPIVHSKTNLGTSSKYFNNVYGKLIYQNGKQVANKEDIPDTSSLASQSYVDAKIADLVNSAPETLDTLGEVATAIQNNDTVVEALNSAIGNKANKEDIPTVNNGTLTIQQDGTTIGTFTANQSGDTTINIEGGGGNSSEGSSVIKEITENPIRITNLEPGVYYLNASSPASGNLVEIYYNGSEGTEKSYTSNESLLHVAKNGDSWNWYTIQLSNPNKIIRHGSTTNSSGNAFNSNLLGIPANGGASGYLLVGQGSSAQPIWKSFAITTKTVSSLSLSVAANATTSATISLGALNSIVLNKIIRAYTNVAGVDVIISSTSSSAVSSVPVYLTNSNTSSKTVTTIYFVYINM